MRVERVFCDICGKELSHPEHPESKLPRVYRAEIEVPRRVKERATIPLAGTGINKYDFCLECLLELIKSIEVRKADKGTEVREA